MNIHDIDSPLGRLRLVARGDELACVHLPPLGEPSGQGVADPCFAADRPKIDRPRVPNDPAPTDGERRVTAIIAATAAQLAEYFAGTRTRFDLPLAPQGTAFQRIVWEQLLAIPYGITRSYGEVARAIGRPAASRAVGAANGRNPIAIIVPCHRVIGADGTLTGYGGGMPAKRWLLDHELRHLPATARPQTELHV